MSLQRKRDGSGDDHVKQNKPDSQRQMFSLRRTM